MLLSCKQRAGVISLHLFSIMSTPKGLNYNSFSSVPCFSTVFSAENLQHLLSMLEKS